MTIILLLLYVNSVLELVDGAGTLKRELRAVAGMAFAAGGLVIQCLA